MALELDPAKERARLRLAVTTRHEKSADPSWPSLPTRGGSQVVYIPVAVVGAGLTSTTCPFRVTHFDPATQCP